ncbi:MAG: hypothetical protein MST00_04660 [Tenericutes bacterium]|nr:hypothetical protein [Mycoplasmatota bacterium]
MKNKEHSYVDKITITILIILFIVSIFLIVNNYINKNKLSKYNDYKALIINSTTKYLNTHKDIKDKLNSDYFYYTISIKELEDDNYLVANLINPKTKEEASKETIGISLDEYNNYVIDYPNNFKDGLNIKTLIYNISDIKYSLEDIINTNKLCITKDGKVEKDALTTDNIKLKSDYTFNSIGIHEITYIYNNEEYSSNIIIVDDTAPKIENISYNKDKYVKSVTLKANILDNDSGIASYAVDTNCSSFKNTNLNLIEEEITENGTYYICVKDLSNNMSKKEIIINNIDNTAPKVNNISFDEKTKILTGQITDNESGVVAYQISKTTSAPSNWVIIEETKKFDKLSYQITENGTYYVWTKDKVGNIGRSSAINLNSVID